MYDRRGKSVLGAFLAATLTENQNNVEIPKRVSLGWWDELTEDPQKVYNKEPKRKAHRHVPDGSVAQWKREINPRKH